MKRILNLIRLDLITMNGKKGGMLIVLLLMIVFFGVLGFLATPLVALYCPIFLGCMFVQTFYRNELKYNSGKLFGILPVARRELVKARFLLTVGLYVIMTGLFHILMLLSAHMKLYQTVMGEFDILEMLAKLAGNTISPTGLLNLLYFAAAAMGLTVIGFNLRMFLSDEENYRKNSKMLFRNDKKSRKRSVAAIIFLILMILYVSPFLQTAF